MNSASQSTPTLAHATGHLDEKVIDCSIFECSLQRLGIVSSSFLREGSELSLDLGKALVIPVVVEKSIGFAMQLRGYCYRLRCLDASIDLESIVPDILQRQPGSGQKLRLQSIRFPVRQDYFLKGRTFGSNVHYKLRIDNISKSGLMIDNSKSPSMNVPFREGTLLELEVEGPDQKPIQLLGKVTRCQTDHIRGVKRLGISLSELTQEMSEAYHKLVDSFEGCGHRREPGLENGLAAGS